MKTVTATEAARHFSSLLTSVEKDGESFVVTRGGRVVARIEPASGASGRAVKALLRRSVDTSWAAELIEVRAAASTQERRWPG